MNLLRISALYLLSAAALPALTISLAPSNGILSGTPGSTVSWGFSLTGDVADWLVITSVQSNPTDTNFTDVLSVFVNNNSYALAPNLLIPWTHLSTPNLAATAGALANYSIPNGAAPGSIILGEILVTYDRYDANPFINGNFLSAGEFARLPYTINVTAPVAIPEPGTLWLTGLVSASVWRQRRRS
ncbi:MAG: PEP-CTERM sorting domain-containing protein [Bryobacteraceae bacterium]|nr:PEP-CTERM sorting domain-containing protein [Bryobacteraceae bacterium]